MLKVDVSELNHLATTLDRSGGQIGAKGAAVVRRTAAAIERDAKAFAPVDTGNLRNSISHDVTGDGRFGSISAEIGPTAEYGHFVEFGTSRMAPHAYMGPALDRNTPGFVTALEALAGRVL